MEIFESISDSANFFQKYSKTNICIGNFDGCHIGHQALIRKVVEKSTKDCPCVILTFDPSPKEYFNKEHISKRLFSRQQKVQALSELGADVIIFEPFNEQFRNIQPSSFIETLAQTLKCNELVVGKNFRFGQNREGNIELLKQHSQLFTLCNIDIRQLRDFDISSTRIRTCLSKGDIAQANDLLGRPYCISGVIKKGQQIGRTIGFPTANLLETQQMLPSPGVYAGYISFDDTSHSEIAPNIHRMHRSVFNLGTRPTIKSSNIAIHIEGHILSNNLRNDCLYDCPSKFYFISQIRSEIKFDSLDKLKEQIAIDCKEADSHLYDFELR